MKQRQLLESIIFFIVVFLMPITAKAYTQTIEVEVGETFSISTTYHSNTTSIFWSYDYGYVEPVGSIGSTTSRVTFKATKPTGNSGIFIQAETTVSYGQNRYVDDWLIVISGEGDGGEGGDGGEPDWLDGWASDKTIEGHTMWFTLSKIYGEYVAQVCKDYQGNPTVSISATDNGKVTIPEYTRGYPVKGIKANSFTNLEYLTELVIPKTVNRIESYIVLTCPKLKKITCLNETPPTYYGSLKAFDQAYNMILYVPSEAAKQKYMTADGWKNFKEYKVVGEEEQGDIAINEENFPDANFRSYLLSQWYGQDAVLTENEIKGVTQLGLNSKGISNLKGIEFFTSLNTLWCTNNQLTSLDITQNPELTDLDCQGNQLASLDVSMNTALVKLWCSNNSLKVLDLSKNVALENLSCQLNQLTSLDISNNKKLTYLYFFCNKIVGTEMDNLISGLPQNTTNDEHSFYAIQPNDEREGNICTEDQVEAVKAKGWFPCYWDYDTKEFKEYDNINNIIVDFVKSVNVYNLSGQRLAAPRKGVNIVGGKKVMIK